MRRRDEREALREELRALSAKELAARLKSAREQLEECAEKEARGLGAFVTREREQWENEVEALKEAIAANKLIGRGKK